MIEPREEFMQAAIDEAVRARANGDYGIGAVIVRDGEILYRGSNKIKIDQDPTQHAEIVAIRKGTSTEGTRFLKGCVLYSTHEPCPMCTSAAIWARMDGIVFGARLEDMIEYRLQHGTEEWTWRTIDVPVAQVLEKGDPKLEVVQGFMREECKKLFHN